MGFILQSVRKNGKVVQKYKRGNSENMNQLAFIGTGNMGGALARAASKCEDNSILLANRHPEKAQFLADQIGGSIMDNVEAAKTGDFIFLGVKPHMLADMLEGIRETLRTRETSFVLVSMVAGTAIQKIQNLLAAPCPIIRIMPNTPASIGEGMILYTCSPEVTAEQEQTFLRAMEHAGRFAQMEERLIDAGSSVSGCGPAFVAMFMEAMADGGVACGLPRDIALQCAAQTIVGTGKLFLETGTHPGKMKDAVCSPGGTTIQGVRALEEGGFRGTVMDAVIAAYEKTLKL